MKSKILLLSLAIVFVFLLAGHVGAGETTLAGQDIQESSLEAKHGFVSCTSWLNCNSASPNYTGFCCRACTDKQGRRGWDCKQRSAEERKTEASFAGRIPIGETTLSGIVTREGLLMADDGQGYVVTGDPSDNLQRNMGKQIEVKGTVKEEQANAMIDVETYTFISTGNANVSKVSETDDSFVSCGGWANCSPLPPTFTGTCCRHCKDKDGGGLWDCEVLSDGEHFDLAEWSTAD